MKWEEKIELGKYAKVISGFAFKSKQFRKAGGIPIIKIKNIRNKAVSLADAVYVEESFLSLDEKYHCQKGDILISLTGSHITLPNSVVGRVARYNFEFLSLLNQRAGKIIIKNPDRLNTSFLYYYLCQKRVRIELAQFGHGGANQCNISPTNVESIEFPLPPLPTQKKIAAILSTYDELIENNRRRIQLLEEAAQNLYREWFVQLRFPGHEQVSMNEETGLPVGWERKRLSENCSLTMGQSPKSEFYNDRKEGLPFHQGVSGYGFRFVKNSTYCTKETRIAEPGDILFSVRAPVGRLNIAKDRLIIGRGLSAIRNNSGFQSFQHYQLKSIFFKENIMGGGAIFNSVTKKDLQNLELITPLTALIEEFEEIVSDIDQQILLLDNQISLLQEARDILLPRLMNQSIEV